MIKAIKKANANDHMVVMLQAKGFKKTEHLDKAGNAFLKSRIEDKTASVEFNIGGRHLIFIPVYGESNWEQSEKLRRAGASTARYLNANKATGVQIVSDNDSDALALAEGMALANYQFIRHKSDKSKLKNTLNEIWIVSSALNTRKLEYINTVIQSVFIARDLVNEPQNFLNAVQLSEEFSKLGKQSGFKVEVWNESRIEAQKMGGLLAVNKGSKTPPTFNIMEYKPAGAVNKKPYVLVGKGVVYDTGGLSLKPTPNSMDAMKCDMAGSAVVAAVMSAVAKLKLPLHVVGLVPATDNWIGENSYAPGDVITMYSGTTVEIMNTDAEGRLILADALHFAKKLNPELVCDFATLTGAAVRAIGPYATAVMGKADDKIKAEIFESSYAVFERLVEFPLWPEYGDELKSEIADMTNLGKGEGGQISAAKFLEHFTDYPWMHFDIAGPAFLNSTDAYRPKGGTGTGVRMMIDFLSRQASKKRK